MEKKDEKKEAKEVKVNIQFSLPSLLNYLAIAAAVLGFLYAILSSVGMEHESGAAQSGQFFLGLLYTVVASGFLLALSEIVSSHKK
jgi:hypothetical protein